ncbi:formimidoylglutamate deiminase [Acidiphilium sp.]|uniref:formimidoylglutamate deiminase n=1 Tax=Acidiphilium sp. TaxID=527 RepID=UPI00258EB57A|nr:formimidoylglutamate deiminase [Acidiphilium sp.]
MRRLWLEQAFLSEGWASGVALDIDGSGRIAGLAANAPPADRETVPGCVLPGLPNLHSHGFQRAMSALAQRRRAAAEDFWSWRGVMYRTALALPPDDIAAVTAMAFMEMLERGFTAVAEFHYLHNDSAGAPYADPAELATRVIEAAAQTGIGLTLLPVLYSAAGPNRPPEPGQRRFITDLDGFLRLHAATAERLRALPGAVLGAAPHSLRAARAADVAALSGLLPEGPLHIHAAEQTGEVAEVEAALGARPVEFLLREAGVDARWCLIHATHMTAEETAGLARAGAVAGLCPITEADLGDGIFNGNTFIDAGGRFGVGTDSNVAIEAPAELRQLEWSQRLRDRRRLVLADPARDGGSTGAALYRAALAGGAQALAQPIGAIAPGCRADLVSLRRAGTDLAALSAETRLDHYIFAGGARLVDRVYVAGRCLVREGRHDARAAIESRFAAALRRLEDAL